MVGEIRDLETAEIAIQASLTGHLVLSTLHTNDAPGAVTRLVDMGVEPFLISSTLIGVDGPAPGRRICPNCKQPYEVDAGDLRAWASSRRRRARASSSGAGGAARRAGRPATRAGIGIYEMMLMNEEIAELIVRRAPLADIKEAARANRT